MNKTNNSIFSYPFLRSLFFTQNKWHQHGVFLHTFRVTYHVLKRGHYKFFAAAVLHDIGKPFSAFVKDEEDMEFNEYSFTDHEERSFQIIKNWPFISEYTKNMVRYHYLIRDIEKSKKEDLARYSKKIEIWNSLDNNFKEDLAEFLICDDLGKGKKKKMKNILVVVVIIAVIIGVFLSLGASGGMVVVKEGNLKKLPLDIKLGHYQDSDCGMVIDDLSFASQVVSPSGKTYFFHDHGGMAKWIKDKDFAKDAQIWVMSVDTKKYIDAKKAYYSIDDETPMGYGFGAYEKKQDGYIDFDEMQLRMLRGETMNNPLIRKKLQGDK